MSAAPENAIQKIARPDLTLETMTRLAQLVAGSEPGAKLPTERELCEMLGVGRSTLREAIGALAFVGAIQVRQGSGTFVNAVGEGGVERLISIALVLERCTVAEVVEVRRMLEVQAARLAAENHAASDRQALEHIMRQMTAAAGSPHAAARHDLEYHVVLARASHNRVLSHLLYGLRPLLEIWISNAVNRTDIIDAILGEHTAILRAVFDRDSERAAAQMFIHQSNAAERLYAVLGKDHSTGSYLSALVARSNSMTSDV
ncbi:MAG: FadR family transcriptional regulator [Acidobacteria bacterium]|nr:FadR family transcriptional regulator [Acidobacteriota bacterium]